MKHRKYFKEKGPRVKDQLRSLDIIPSKARGQNFIIDRSVVESIAQFGAPKAGESLIEIGPGLGALTEILAPFGNLTVVEIENRFCKDLAARFPEIKIISSDVRVVDFSELGSNLVVFGNLPYSFSTDIIFHLIAFSSSISRAVVMLQKEFAQRVAAPVGGRDYGVLSISVQLEADVKLGPIIPGSAFHPPAAVDSQLLELRFPKQNPYKVEDMFWLKRVVAAAFKTRRKMLKNTLKASGIRPGDVVDRAFVQCEIDPQRRPETLTIEEFIILAKALTS